MGDKTEGKNNLLRFFTTFTAPVVGVVSLATTLLTFIKLFNDPKDAGILIIILLVFGILAIVGVCLYYARFWQPEKTDQDVAGFMPALDDQQVKQQQRKEKQRQKIRRLAVVGLVAIPLLSFSGFGYWQHLQNQPSQYILILVADFEAKDDQNYFVTKTIFENLESAIEPYPDVKVKRVNTSFPSSKEAREEGEKQKASIVIWGSYGKTKEKVLISANFELLKKPEYQPDLAPEARGKVRATALTDLESFRLQPQLAEEMNYLTFATLGLSKYAANDWDGAISLFDNALDQAKAPTNAINQSFIYSARAHSYFEKQQYQRAIQDYTQAIQLDSKDAFGYRNRGLAKFVLGNKKGAVQDFDQAIKLDIKYAVAYFNRGLAKYDLDDNKGAIQDFDQAIKLEFKDTFVYFNRGLAKYDLGKLQEAIQDFDQAIKLDPKHAAAYTNRGRVKAALGKPQEAIPDHDQAIKLDPKNATAYIARGVAKATLGRLQEAIPDYDQAIKLDPKSAIAYNNRGVAYGEAKAYEKALSDVNRAIDLDPRAAYAYDSRGTVYRYMQKYKQALNDYSEAIRLAPQKQDVSYLWRGVVYLEIGNQQNAINDFRKVLELTQNPEFKKRAERELQKLGDKP